MWSARIFIMATTYCGVFCKGCNAFLRLDQFDDGEPKRDLILDPADQLYCEKCGKRCRYSRDDAKYSSSPGGANPRDRA
jgi:hypothetical protein